MYNLDEQLMSKSLNQIKAMLTTRKNKELKANEYIEKHSSWIYEDNKKVQTQINKQQENINDCWEWYHAAAPLFSAELWDSIIGEVFGHIDGRSHSELTE